MNIIIDKTEFWNLEAMKYWQHSSTTPIEKKREESKYMCMSGNYWGSTKRDGAWCMFIKDNDGNYYTRSRTESVNGGFQNKIEWVPQLISNTSLPNGTVLLGEIYIPNNEGSRKVTSVFNCLKEKCLERQEKGTKLHFYVFDVLAYNGKSLIKEPFETRINTYLSNLVAEALKDNEYFEIAEYKCGPALWDLYGEVIAAGGEGIVITHKDCEYLPGKRTARKTLKMKKEINQTIDVFLSGKYKAATREYKGITIENWPYWINIRTNEKVNICKFDEYVNGEAWEPITKAYYHGWASSIEICVLKNGIETPIGYISGITDEVKKGIVENPNSYIHRVYEVSAMEIEHIDDHYSLRHGKILQERTDKSWEDCDFSQIEQ